MIPVIETIDPVTAEGRRRRTPHAARRTASGLPRAGPTVYSRPIVHPLFSARSLTHFRPCNMGVTRFSRFHRR